jgi:hypothetical protein
MATATKTHGIALACPHCGARHDDDSRGLCLEVGTGELFCHECDEVVTRADLERVQGELERLLRLLDLVATV